MQLDISKRILRAGDVIEITWDCSDCVNPRLCLNTGTRETSLSIPPTGSKRFRMKNSHGKHSIAITGTEYGREKRISKRFFVWGTPKKEETDHFEYVDRGETTPLHRWNNAVSNWWHSFPQDKKRLYIILLLLLAYNFMQSIPSLHTMTEILFLGILFWLFWQVVKKE